MVLHHVGYVVASIEASAPEFARSLAVEWDGRIIHDPLQIVKVSFLPSLAAPLPLIELVEPAGPRSPVRTFAEQGGGLHHLCYEVENLQEALARSTSVADAVVRVPLPAKAFDGRRIAWVRTSQKLLIEYLEAPRQP